MKFNTGNIIFGSIGFLGFMLGVIVFILIASGIGEGEMSARSGIVLFVSFVMCAGVAFAGLMIMALTQIGSTLRRIEVLLKAEVEKGK